MAHSAHRWQDTLMFISSHPGCEQKDVLANVYADVKDRNYGRQSPASAAIAMLRSKGLVVDNTDRCPHCGRASRAQRNVPLTVTDAGKALVRKLRRAMKKAA